MSMMPVSRGQPVVGWFVSLRSMRHPLRRFSLQRAGWRFSQATRVPSGRERRCVAWSSCRRSPGDTSGAAKRQGPPVNLREPGVEDAARKIRGPVPEASSAAEVEAGLSQMRDQRETVLAIGMPLLGQGGQRGLIEVRSALQMIANELGGQEGTRREPLLAVALHDALWALAAHAAGATSMTACSPTSSERGIAWT